MCISIINYKKSVMKKNMGTTDRSIRLVIALIVAALYFTGNISGVIATIGIAVAVIFLFTSFLGVCPLYNVLGVSTCKKEKP